MYACLRARTNRDALLAHQEVILQTIQESLNPSSGGLFTMTQDSSLQISRAQAIAPHPSLRFKWILS
jgi:hypothetical protein